MSNKGLTSFEKLVAQREELINKHSEKDRLMIEENIRAAFKAILERRRDDYFNYDDFEEIPNINLFPIRTFTSDRNIGKSYSSFKQMQKVNDMGRTWIKMRNNQDEAKASANSDLHNYFENKVTMKGGKNADVYAENGDLLGYYRDINTSAKYKSTDFPNVKLIIWDEFNSRVQVTDKASKFIEFVSTVIRFKKDVTIIAMSNYVNPNDEWLLATQASEDENKEIVFNWFSGTINFFIPSGIYKSVGDVTENLGYRLALTNPKLFKTQYGGEFAQDKPVNVRNFNDVIAYTPHYNIYYDDVAIDTREYGAYRMTLITGYLRSGSSKLILLEQFEPNDKPIIVYDIKTLVRYPSAKLFDIETLAPLINKWFRNEIFTTDIATHKRIVKMFTLSIEKMRQDEIIGNVDEL